jgi:hypothetical protein
MREWMFKFQKDVLKKTPLKFVQHDDYTETFRDPFKQRFLRIHTLQHRKKTLRIMGSQFTFIPHKTFQMSMSNTLRFLPKVSLGTYTYLDGVVYPPTTLETAEYTP